MENNMQNGRGHISKSWVNRKVTYGPQTPLSEVPPFTLSEVPPFTLSEPTRAGQPLTPSSYQFPKPQSITASKRAISS